MICLFVSFEVKSESDDLTGLKLLCQNDQNKTLDNDTYYDDYIGYEFEENFKLIYFSFTDSSYKGEKQHSFDTQYYWSYRTTLNKVKISLDKDYYDYNLKMNKELDYHTFDLKKYKYIIRQSLKSKEMFYGDLYKPDGKYEKNFTCKIFNGDLKNHFNQLKNNYEKKLKSKQKI